MVTAFKTIKINTTVETIEIAKYCILTVLEMISFSSRYTLRNGTAASDALSLVPSW